MAEFDGRTMKAKARKLAEKIAYSGKTKKEKRRKARILSSSERELLRRYRGTGQRGGGRPAVKSYVDENNRFMLTREYKTFRKAVSSSLLRTSYPPIDGYLYEIFLRAVDIIKKNKDLKELEKEILSNMHKYPFNEELSFTKEYHAMLRQGVKWKLAWEVAYKMLAKSYLKKLKNFIPIMLLNENHNKNKRRAK